MVEALPTKFFHLGLELRPSSSKQPQPRHLFQSESLRNDYKCSQCPEEGCCFAADFYEGGGQALALKVIRKHNALCHGAQEFTAHFLQSYIDKMFLCSSTGCEEKFPIEALYFDHAVTVHSDEVPAVVTSMNVESPNVCNVNNCPINLRT
jgi:hypothetical protein